MVEDFNGAPNDHMMAVANHLNPQYNNNNSSSSLNKNGGNNLDPMNNDVEFESEVDVNNGGGIVNNNFNEQPSGMDDGGVFNGGGASLQDGIYEEGNHNDMDHFAEGVEADDNEGGDGEEDEGESVYMIDGVVMRMIQIEGEDN